MLLPSDATLDRLRLLLVEMTQGGTSPSQHRVMLAKIGAEVPHSIEPVDATQDVASFTCGMHAFGFETSELYAVTARHGLGLVFSGPEFFRWLIDSGRLEEIGDGAPPDSIVMYFAGGRPVHVGRLLTASRVISKWGIGLLYDHEIAEVPEQYGSEVRCFVGIDYDTALDHFLAFAQERGIEFED